ncbi:hypothetical protein [Plantactinospora sp. GCM10030261]|uniref:hypothetical protein n=1 Tax=Plantactinospora sp. GCM10030261 TaxID=3273420 RepID=UPI00360A6DE2
MPDPDMTLAMTAATTIVAAMATSIWQTTKSEIARLFRRHGAARDEIEARLERSAARVHDAAEPHVVRDAQVTRWREDIEDLLRDNPEAEDELRTLLDEISQQLPPIPQRWIQHIEARDGGFAVGAQGPGSQIILHRYAAPEPDRASSSAEGTW